MTTMKHLSTRSHKFNFFFDKELLDGYREYQDSQFDSVVALTTFFLGVTFVMAKESPTQVFSHGFYFALSGFFFLTSVLLYGTFVFARVVHNCVPEERSLLRKMSSLFLGSSWIKPIALDGTAFCGILGMSISLYARVVRGQCPDNASYWESQRCNQLGNSKTIPVDQLIYVTILPIYCQLLMKGMSFRMAFICCVITTVSVTLSIMHATGSLDVGTLLCQLRVLLMTYSYEKLSRLTFVNNRMTSAAEVTNRKHILLKQQAEHQLMFEKNKHELEIQAIKAEEECRLVESEKKQMIALLGNVARDLKTPLQSFMMDLESLKVSVGFVENGNAAVDDINSPLAIVTTLSSTCSFMSMAINRAIDFVKASRNLELVPRMETLNIRDEISVALNFVRPLKSSLTIILNPLPSTMCFDIITDKHWFLENMLCLLSNAVKYSNKGVITVTVDHVLTYLPESDPPHAPHSGNTSNVETPLLPHPKHRFISSIMLSIEDNGIGIPENARKDLFQPFKQVQRLAGGTGLGLFSLSNRIRALEGSRGVKERKDLKQGSVFWFAIPYRPDPNVPSPDLCSTPNKISCITSIPVQPGIPGSRPGICNPENSTFHLGGCGQFRKIRFLVVDDSPSILKVVSRVLLTKRHKVEMAENGSAGLDILIDRYGSGCFDMVLMDLQMPVMDGIEAVRRYREFETKQCRSQANYVDGDNSSDLPLNGCEVPCTKPLFIVGMSANSDVATKQCALDAGMDTFLSKPFTMTELQPLIDQLNIT